MIDLFKIIFIALFVTHAVVFEGEANSREISVCEAAHAPSIYVKSVEFSDEVKIRVADYKNLWRKFCSDSSSVAIPEIIAVIRILEKHFEPIVARVASDFEGSAYATQEKYLREEVPRFIPGFRASVEEYVYFNFDLAAFKNLYKKGTDEDIRFFDVYFGVRGVGHFPKWYTQTWDFGGCVLFGEYDWLSALKKLEASKEIKDPVYKEKLKGINLEFDRTFKDKKYFCTCDEKTAVETDLKKMVSGLKENKIRPKLAQHLSQVVSDIHQGKIIINSFHEGDPCGG